MASGKGNRNAGASPDSTGKGGLSAEQRARDEAAIAKLRQINEQMNAEDRRKSR